MIKAAAVNKNRLLEFGEDEDDGNIFWLGLPIIRKRKLEKNYVAFAPISL